MIALRAAAGAALLVAGFATLLWCGNVDAGLGSPCIRNEDCLSGICAGQICVAQPTLLTSIPSSDAGDAASDAPVDGAAADAADAATSTSTPPPMSSSSTSTSTSSADAAESDAHGPEAGDHEAGALKDSGSPKDAHEDHHEG
jgi:hypothetical protein